MANGTAGKRYYWLRQRDDFFNTLRMKKLRRTEGGCTLIVIYQMMLLKAMKSEGELTYSGVEPDLAGELAIEFDEDVENVRRTLDFLVSCGLAELTDGGCLLPEAVENTGCEGASAQRMRDKRARDKEASVTPRAQCDADVTHAFASRDGEIEIEKEKRDREEIKDREKIRDKALTGEETSPSRPSPPAGTGTACFSSDNAAGKGMAEREGNRSASEISAGTAGFSLDSDNAADISKNGVLKYGEYRNVKLSDDDLEKLKAEFPSDWRARIENLSAYIASTGKSYRSHLATIRNWARMERERGPTPRGKGYEGGNVFLEIAREEGIV